MFCFCIFLKEGKGEEKENGIHHISVFLQHSLKNEIKYWKIVPQMLFVIYFQQLLWLLMIN